MASLPVLSLTVFLPLLGAVLIMLIPGHGQPDGGARSARKLALGTSLLVFAVSLTVWLGFDPSLPGYQFEETVEWISGLNSSYHLGVDGISLFFMLLTTFTTPIAILIGWNRNDARTRELMAAFLVFESASAGMFLALDFLVFFLFYEAVLLPAFVIIGVWGGQRRTWSAITFFLYTMFGSVFMLIALLVFFFQFGVTDIPVLARVGHGLGRETQLWLWLALLASFVVKIPLWPVHTWLPEAYVEAPTGASVLLAGVLLKIGGYIFLRFSIPMLPVATEILAPLIYALAVVALIYLSFVVLMLTLALEDLKKWVAYAVLAHMGFGYIGMFTMTTQGLQGAIFVLISYGLIATALFCCVGVLEERASSREISRFSGLVGSMPKFALVLMVFMLASLGVPGTSGFVGEFLVLVGAYQASSWLALFSASIIVLGCVYFLWMYRLVVFGKAVRADCRSFADLSGREMAIMVPLMAVILWMGIYPDSFLHDTAASVATLIHNYQSTFADAGGAIVAAR